MMVDFPLPECAKVSLMYHRIIVIFITLLSLTSLAVGVAPARGYQLSAPNLPIQSDRQSGTFDPNHPGPVSDEGDGDGGDEGDGVDEGEDEGGGGIISNIIQYVIHKIVFPADTLYDALTEVLNKAAEKEAESLSNKTANWAGVIGQVIQAPSQGFYNAAARSGLPTAAALAPALFLLRLAMYHWNSLLGNDDNALGVFGDWVTAGILAVASGPFLDLLTELSWWMAGKALGETADLARAFVLTMSVPSVIAGSLKATFFSGFIVVGMAIIGLLAVAGMMFAFASANATMYVMAITAPAISVASVIPQMRWLRSLWVKATAVIALLPIVAGGIFKAGIMAGNPFNAGGGLLSVLIRLMWLTGAVGFMISLAGILGKFTLSASVGAFQKMVGATKAVVQTAALAAAGAGAGGTSGGAGAATGGAAASGGGNAGSALVSAGAGVGGDSISSGGELGAALQHYQNAQGLTGQAQMYDRLGLNKLSREARSNAQMETLSARQSELRSRMNDVVGHSPISGKRGNSDDMKDAENLGFDQAVLSRAVSDEGFNGSVGQFAQNYRAMDQLAQASGFTLGAITPKYPTEVGRMAQVYQQYFSDFENSANPLRDIAQRAGADDLAELFQN